MGDARDSFFVSLLLLGVSAGCSGTPSQPGEAPVQARQEAKAAQTVEDSARQQIDQIPPPSKSLYLAVHTESNWANPFLIVGRENIHIRVTLPDANPSPMGEGTLLRPADARKHELDVRMADLPSALSAIPTQAWPYGRVVAVEESPVTAKVDKHRVRRNVESTIQVLNDLGVVVDEWTGPTGSLLR